MGAGEKTEIQDDAINSELKSVAVKCSAPAYSRRDVRVQAFGGMFRDTAQSGEEWVRSKPSRSRPAPQGLNRSPKWLFTGLERFKCLTKEPGWCVQMEKDAAFGTVWDTWTWPPAAMK